MKNDLEFDGTLQMESQFFWRTINDVYTFELGMMSLWLFSLLRHFGSQRL